jgi:hypothetical protein
MSQVILSRVTEHVRAQNWTAVFLDFVIVVVGVFIGIQVANWNDARVARASEARYLMRLHEDLAVTRDRLEADLGWQRENASRARFLLQRLRSCALGDEEQDAFATGLFVIGKLNLPLLVDTTLEELKSSGQLNILSNDALTSDLINLQRLFSVSAGHFDMIKRWTTAPVNVINERVIYLDLDENSGEESVIAWSDIDFDFERACDDRAFIGAVSALHSYTHENARRDRVLLEATEAVIASVTAELEGKAPGWESAD